MVQNYIQHEKNTLCIRLTESVVFLRISDPTGRDRNQNNEAPAMVRGLLTLNVVKPTRISSIEIELQGKATTSSFEGVGARRIEVTEQYKVFSASTVFFQAASLPSARRTASVGPGLPGFDYDHDHAHDEVHPGEYSSVPQHAPHPNGLPSPTFYTRSASMDPRQPPSSINGRSFSDNTILQHDTHTPLHQDTIHLPPTPPYSPPLNSPSFIADHRASPSHSHSDSISQSSGHPKPEDSPAQTLEDLRQALVNNIEAGQPSHRSSFHAPTAGSSSSSIYSHRDVPLSRRPSIEDISETQQLSPQSSRFSSRTRTSPVESQSPTQTSTVASNNAAAHEDRGRKYSRFSFHTVANVIDTMVERVRSRSPRAESQRRSKSINGDGERGRTLDRGKGKLPEQPSHENDKHKHYSALGKVGEFLGLEEEHKEVGEGWKEFKKGTYTYPISFTIPNNSPPTIECDYGSMIWRLKAEVHRPGAFTQKLTAQREVLVVAAPSEDDTEDSENIIIERQWESQLQYLIAVSGRRFPTGGTIPIDLTIIPFTKAKVHRISVHIDERIEYHTQTRRLVRSQLAHRIPLLSLENEVEGESHPLLPLISDDPEAFRKSPLYRLLNAHDDENEMAMAVMGPGPWTFHQELQLPRHCSLVHFSNRNKKSNITINHTLKIVIRVERGDHEATDPQTKKPKLYDILVQMPVRILSCHCTPAWISLPRYYEVLERDFDGKRVSCPCDLRASHCGPDDSELHTPISLNRVGSIDSTVSSSTENYSPGGHSGTLVQTLVGRSTQYERLMSGMESEAGEAPPAYESIDNAFRSQRGRFYHA
ncbi:uncharacterized protein F5891DRAFT_1018584 [Suillus fuscotomentosus]|uniref:Arrestin C-terminal-like domain-containing protein n=1 Tax=Suillus fuscotomentosus TaxID=1912939 RepID=A0AAD4EBM1_9AGAM|nr:uncharacterized protein F5891DRAFT_1018584 [Suillus fuscotomentosus]KAG1903293.1 hypothetical protein F5891DRAFT_1018584 [Suillus fuscotomentosus]